MREDIVAILSELGSPMELLVFAFIGLFATLCVFVLAFALAYWITMRRLYKNSVSGDNKATFGHFAKRKLSITRADRIVASQYVKGMDYPEPAPKLWR